jgi:hypothetical protein
LSSVIIVKGNHISCSQFLLSMQNIAVSILFVEIIECKAEYIMKLLPFVAA